MARAVNQTADSLSSRVDPDDVRQQLAGKHACPFCGVIRADPQQPCARCTMEDTGATRTATRQRIGPWFVLQARNPSAPGMKFTTLLQLVKKGHVTPRSIVRGPTSQQLWTFAAKLRGLAREFGLCWHCGESVEPTSLTCGHCGYSQDLPANPDVLFEPPEATPPDIMADTKLPAGDTGMDGGTSLDLQVSDFSPPAPAAAPAPAPAFVPAPRPIQRTAPAPAPAPAPVKTPAPAALPARRPNGPVLAERPTPPVMGRDEGILSARELAAAFQLDFKPPADANARRKGSLLRTIVALLLIAAVSAAITLALRPDWRTIVFDAAGEKLNLWKTKLEEPAKPSTSTSNTAIAKAPTPTAPVKPAPAPAPKPAPVIEKPAPVAPAPVEPTPAPAPAPTAETPPVIATPPTPPTPAPDPTPKPIPTPPPPVPPTPTPTPPTPSLDLDSLTLDQAIEKASQWRNQAMDAQAKGDWTAAVKLYEQIEKLPRDAWPSDVELKLDIARKRASQ